MARVPLDPPRTVTLRATEFYSRRRVGTVMEPALAMGHSPRLLRTVGRFELAVQRWSAVPGDLAHLAQMAAAATIGCEWCMDFGHWLSISEGLDPRKVRDVPRWRDSDVYTDVERAVLEYAEAASTTPLTVTDALVARLREHLDDAALVELTMMIGIENQRARFNAALGLSDQRFSDRCEVAPLR